MTDYDGKVCLVTGGSRGIGRAICQEFARCGYHVIINYKSNEDAANETLRLIQEAGGRGETVRFDVSRSEECEKALEEVFSRFTTIDALVNNAGITADNLFLMMPERDWDTVMDTTLKGFYNVTKVVLKKMLRKKSGSVVSISSVAALTGNKGQANYAAAKAGLIAASKSIAAEIAKKGIRLNVIAPGLIETEMIKDAPIDMIKSIIPMGRIGMPEEVARVARFLCSDDASYITGQVLSVNGGMF